MTHQPGVKSAASTPTRSAFSTSGVAYFHGRFMPIEDANVNIMTHAFLYGTAVFEGIRGYADQDSANQIYVFRLAEHLERLRRSARVLRMKLTGTTEELIEITKELIQAGNFKCDVYIRVNSYKSALGIGMKLDDQEDLFMFALPVQGKYLATDTGIHMAISSWRRIEDNAIPSRAKINGSYVNLALSAEEIRSNGFDEALLLNEDGHVSEAAGMNVFLVRNGHLITPGVTENILEGITRHSIICLAKSEMGIDTVERQVDRSELYTADEIFLSGTAAEVVPVVSLDRRPIGDGKIGSITSSLSRIYERVVRGGVSRYENWLVPVY